MTDIFTREQRLLEASVNDCITRLKAAGIGYETGGVFLAAKLADLAGQIEYGVPGFRRLLVENLQVRMRML